MCTQYEKLIILDDDMILHLLFNVFDTSIIFSLQKF